MRYFLVFLLLVTACRTVPRTRYVPVSVQRQTDVSMTELIAKAKAGDAEMQFKLGMMYEVGDGVTQNYIEAVKWYLMAAELAYVQAQLQLGLMYDLGRGIPQNYVLAHMWYNIAGITSSAKAVRLRDMLAEHMSAEQIAEAQKLAKEWMAAHSPTQH